MCYGYLNASTEAEAASCSTSGAVEGPAIRKYTNIIAGITIYVKLTAVYKVGV